MDKFSVNFGVLKDTVNNKTPIFRYADVKHKLQKVAFDIVRFVDTDNIDGLWQIKQTDDGEVIVAMYSENAQVEKTSSSNWNAISDSFGHVNLFYKNTPVTKISLAKLGMTDASPDTVCTVLAEKLDNNSKLLKGLLASLSVEERKDLLNAHPELTNVKDNR